MATVGGGGVSGSTTNVNDKRGSSLSRADSGASSIANFGKALEGKKRQGFIHVRLLKLQDITRVLDLSAKSPERAAFCLLVRAVPPEEYDEILTFCLAASVTASMAVASGKCPEPVESAVASMLANLRVPSFKEIRSDTTSEAGDEPSPEAKSKANGESSLTKLNFCIREAKSHFLKSLCHNIMQVSCVANDPAQLLVELDPTFVLEINLDDFFDAMISGSHKSKRWAPRLRPFFVYFN